MPPIYPESHDSNDHQGARFASEIASVGDRPTAPASACKTSTSTSGPSPEEADVYPEANELRRPHSATNSPSPSTAGFFPAKTRAPRSGKPAIRRSTPVCDPAKSVGATPAAAGAPIKSREERARALVQALEDVRLEADGLAKRERAALEAYDRFCADFGPEAAELSGWGRFVAERREELAAVARVLRAREERRPDVVPSAERLRQTSLEDRAKRVAEEMKRRLLVEARKSEVDAGPRVQAPRMRNCYVCGRPGVKSPRKCPDKDRHYAKA